jgi:hypothetical protein
MRTRTLVLALAVALLAALAFAPSASALRTSVRAEGATFQVMPTTIVTMPAQRQAVTDTAGHSFTNTDISGATAANALYWATQQRGVTWDFGVSSFGLFINAIGGQSADPTTFADWWEVTVNGFAPALGVGSLPAKAGDHYVLFQNPDAGYPPHGGQLLVVRVSALAVKKGRALKITVVGDDLAKVNSAADAKRFGATKIETPAQFKAIAGATLHVGNRVFALTGSSVTIKDLPVGSFAVWAEKAMDASFVYARSTKTIVHVVAR